MPIKAEKTFATVRIEKGAITKTTASHYVAETIVTTDF
jgi:hypothetical protein